MAEGLSPAELSTSNGGQVLALVIAFPVLAFITVVLRLYTRFLVIRNASSEDLCIGIAMLLSIATTVCTCYEVEYGLGRHIQAVPQTDLGGYFKALYASIIVYNFGLLFTKVSILLQYLRICVQNMTRKTIFGVMVVVTLYGIETFLTGVFQCTPVAYFWDLTIPGGKCVDRWALYFANGGINIVTDFLILLLPVFILKDLQVPKLQKMFLMAIIALGGLACIASIFRLHVLYKLSKSPDPTWDGPGTATWSCIELNVGIICGSISTLRPLFARFVPKMFASQHRTATQAPHRQYTFSRSHLKQSSKGGKFGSLEDSEQLELTSPQGAFRSMSAGSGTGSAKTDMYTSYEGRAYK